MKFIVPVLVLIGLAACHSNNEQGATGKTDTTVLQAPYATVFYDSLQAAMDSYYSLTEGMTEANLTYIDKFGAQLKQHLDSLPLHTLQMDSGRLAGVQTKVGTMSAELSGMIGEQKIEGKRAAYDIVSGTLYDLIKVTGLKGKTIYRQYCPMALNDNGAFWLTNSGKKINPYFGNDMLGCVEVTDSLRFN